jgi:hypothetical protein
MTLKLFYACYKRTEKGVFVSGSPMELQWIQNLGILNITSGFCIADSFVFPRHYGGNKSVDFLCE